MCGRYNLRATPQELQQFFHLFRADGLPAQPRYNIAPTQTVPIIRLLNGQRESDAVRWGLVPSWSKELKSSAPLINARGDTVAEKPSFRTAFKRRRCLIPASGFYEWRREGKAKVPFHIHQTSDHLLAFAGLWETWDKAETPLTSCTIITTDANQLMSTIHDRMPVILKPDQWEIWLDPEVDPKALQEFIQPYAGKDLKMDEANPLVNNARNEGAGVLEG